MVTRVIDIIIKVSQWDDLGVAKRWWTNFLIDPKPLDISMSKYIFPHPDSNFVEIDFQPWILKIFWVLQKVLSSRKTFVWFSLNYFNFIFPKILIMMKPFPNVGIFWYVHPFCRILWDYWSNNQWSWLKDGDKEINSWFNLLMSGFLQ